MVSRRELEEYGAANNGIVAMAQKDLADFWRLLDTSNPLEVKVAMLEFMPELITAYGESAAVLAADFYDSVRPEGLPAFQAIMAEVPSVNQIESVTKYNLGPVFKGDPDSALKNMANVTQRLVNQPGRQTIELSADKDPSNAGWARVPVGSKTCSFCRMLAGRGAVYSSKKAAGYGMNRYHNNCDCKAVPMWSEDDYPQGYDPEALYEEYANAHEPGMSTKETLKAIRENDEPLSLTGWDRWAAGRDVDVYSGARPAYNPDNPLEFYGNALDVADESAVSESHLMDLEKFSEPAHRKLRDHFAGQPDGGFYVGDKAMPELDKQQDLRGVRPRGWAEGQTWDNVPGGYDSGKRVCACGGGGKGHGTTSLALHEASHALDDALGRVSGSDGWRDTFYAVHGNAFMNPYFTYDGNPTGFLSEGFAESYASFTKSRAEGRDVEDGIAEALGIASRRSDTMDVIRGLVGFFTKMEHDAMG